MNEGIDNRNMKELSQSSYVKLKRFDNMSHKHRFFRLHHTRPIELFIGPTTHAIMKLLHLPHESTHRQVFPLVYMRSSLVMRILVSTVQDHRHGQENAGALKPALIATGSWDGGTVTIFLWAAVSVPSTINAREQTPHMCKDFALSAIATWVPMYAVPPLDIIDNDGASAFAEADREVPDSWPGKQSGSSSVRALAFVRSLEGNSNCSISLIAGGGDGTVAVTHLGILLGHGRSRAQLHTLACFQVGHEPVRFETIWRENDHANSMQREGSGGRHESGGSGKLAHNGTEGVLVNGDEDAILLPRTPSSRTEISVVRQECPWQCVQV